MRLLRKSSGTTSEISNTCLYNLPCCASDSSKLAYLGRGGRVLQACVLDDKQWIDDTRPLKQQPSIGVVIGVLGVHTTVGLSKGIRVHLTGLTRRQSQFTV
jgi:hypothetical protein